MRSNQPGFLYLTCVRLLHRLNLSIWHSFNVSSAQMYNGDETWQRRRGVDPVQTVLECLVPVMHGDHLQDSSYRALSDVIRWCNVCDDSDVFMLSGQRVRLYY